MQRDRHEHEGQDCPRRRRRVDERDAEQPADLRREPEEVAELLTAQHVRRNVTLRVMPPPEQSESRARAQPVHEHQLQVAACPSAIGAADEEGGEAAKAEAKSILLGDAQSEPRVDMPSADHFFLTNISAHANAEGLRRS